MPARVHKFTSIQEMEFFLRGGLLGSASIAPQAAQVGGSRSAGGGFVGLVGLQLTIAAPALTHTFVAATLAPGETRDPNILLFKDIQAQIKAAQAALDVVNLDGRIGLVETTPTNGISLAAVDQAARKILGLPNNQAVLTRVYNKPGGAEPSFEAYNAQNNMHVIITWE